MIMRLWVYVKMSVKKGDLEAFKRLMFLCTPANNDVISFMELGQLFFVSHEKDRVIKRPLMNQESVFFLCMW